MFYFTISLIQNYERLIVSMALLMFDMMKKYEQDQKWAYISLQLLIDGLKVLVLGDGINRGRRNLFIVILDTPAESCTSPLLHTTTRQTYKR